MVGDDVLQANLPHLFLDECLSLAALLLPIGGQDGPLRQGQEWPYQACAVDAIEEHRLTLEGCIAGCKKEGGVGG